MDASREHEHEESAGEGREPSKAKEVFRSSGGEARAQEKPGAGPTKPMSDAGWFGTPFMFAVGLTALGAGAALAAVHAQQRARAGADVSITGSVVKVLVWGVVGSLLGFAALKGVAVWRKRVIGDTRLAAVRMFAATGLFMLVLNMGIAPTGWWVADRPMAMGLATAVYLSVVWATFRLTREDAMAVLIAHALAWVGVYGAVKIGPRLWKEPAAERAAPAEERTFEPPHAPAAPAPGEQRPTPSQPPREPPGGEPAPSPTPEPAPEPTPAPGGAAR